MVLALSYEIPLLTFGLSFAAQIGTINLTEYNSGGAPFLFSFIFLYSFFFISLAESHRLPFDFVEAERELVSGYNVEYGGWGFALLIISEYRALLLLGQVITYFLFWKGPSLLYSVIGLFISLVFLSYRGSSPRMG